MAETGVYEVDYRNELIEWRSLDGWLAEEIVRYGGHLEARLNQLQETLTRMVVTLVERGAVEVGDVIRWMDGQGVYATKEEAERALK